MSDSMYIRNPFRDTGNVSAERAWDILYERYQSQYDNKKKEVHAIYGLPSIQDGYRYVKMKEDFDKKTKQLENLLLPIDIKIQLHQIYRDEFYKEINKLSLRKDDE
jgi:hypothetical protein